MTRTSETWAARAPDNTLVARKWYGDVLTTRESGVTRKRAGFCASETVRCSRRRLLPYPGIRTYQAV